MNTNYLVNDTVDDEYKYAESSDLPVSYRRIVDNQIVSQQTDSSDWIKELYAKSQATLSKGAITGIAIGSTVLIIIIGIILYIAVSPRGKHWFGIN